MLLITIFRLVPVLCAGCILSLTYALGMRHFAEQTGRDQFGRKTKPKLTLPRTQMLSILIL
jgi:hypothetical protein